jgi:uncharacterized LabA/DUF88 family protein
MKQISYAFIDAQNLTKGTTLDLKPWKIDLKKFLEYMKVKYGVDKAFYFIGVYDRKLEKLYKFLEYNGYEVVFREHDVKATGRKKGNVDTDIVFEAMNEVFVKKKSIKVVLVSGDGDYKKMVSLLIKKNKFVKLLFPNRKWSSLYKKLDDRYFAKLYTPDIRKILELKPESSTKK